MMQTIVHAPSEDITPHDKIPYRANLDAALLALKPETKRAYTRALRPVSYTHLTLPTSDLV